MRLVSLLALLALLLVSCGTAEPTEEDLNNPPEEMAIPSWFFDTPSEPGQAFYGVGSGGFKNSAMMQLAIDTADAAARQQIAATMETTIQACVQRYMRSIVTAEGDIEEEALSQSVSRAVVDTTINGAAIIKRSVSPEQESDGTRVMYALARIGFDGVSQSMYEHTRAAVQEVQDHAEVAFDELDALLAQTQEEKNGTVPPPQADPAAAQ